MHITPVPLLERLLVNEHAHLILTKQVLQYPEYARFYAERAAAGDFVMLDASTFEDRGKPTPTNAMAQAALAIRPSEMALPDAWHETPIQQYERALRAAREFREYAELDKTHFYVVPHGSNLGEYLEAATRLVSIYGVRTIGVYAAIGKVVGKPRVTIVRELNTRFPDMHIHLLGCPSSLVDLTSEALRSTARSIDTSKFVMWGLRNQLVIPEQVPGHSGRPADFWQLTATEEQLQTAAANIELWNLIAAHRDDVPLGGQRV